MERGLDYLCACTPTHVRGKHPSSEVIGASVHQHLPETKMPPGPPCIFCSQSTTIALFSCAVLCAGVGAEIFHAARFTFPLRSGLPAVYHPYLQVIKAYDVLTSASLSHLPSLIPLPFRTCAKTKHPRAPAGGDAGELL